MKGQPSGPSGRQITQYIAYLYQEYSSRLYCSAFHCTSNKSTAEDAVQRVFERVLLYPTAVLNVPEDEVLFFLFAILRNVMRTIASEEEKNAHLPLNYEDGLESYDLADPEDAYLRFINLQSTKDKLSKLKPELCDIMIFHYVYGFKNREIADMFRISERAVKKRISVAKKELRKMFRKEDFL